ncbi:MAG TPA: FKBP-type peptidyl-prolyl cis-trans isomerase [Gemmatimonadota bacterium]|nr:FKBP-type peptidyl-prolyl cis-trans isomerase [Gemmatimonadota bacterium]
MRYRFLTTAALAAALACGGGDEADTAEGELYDDEAAPAEAVEAEAAMATEFAPELEIDLASMEETESGLRYAIVREGTGAVAAPGDEAVVHYTGWLPDGTEFDSSRGRDPFPFVVGAGRVIPGWDEGLMGMAEGTRFTLVIPPAQGYGASGFGGVIPPNATLVFDIEVLEVNAGGGTAGP